MEAASGVSAAPMSEVRARILETAYELFFRRGVRNVGINEVIEHAHVTKATLYHHFASKDDLVVAFLELREQRWMRGWVQTEARRRADTPEEELPAIFDLYDEWSHRDDYEVCSFVNVLLELGATHNGHPTHRRPPTHHPPHAAREPEPDPELTSWCRVRIIAV
jgi:AcrR family transcriptional regulator